MSQTGRIYRGKSLTVEPSCKDEARVGQKGTLTRLWARKGTRPRAVRDTRYQWTYLFGAVCPDRGVGAGLVMPYANTEAMNKHLEEIGKAVTPGAHAALIFDGAGWPTLPELNAADNVWEYLRKNKLANRLYETYEDSVEACCDAWNSLMAMPDRIASIAARTWAKVS